MPDCHFKEIPADFLVLLDAIKAKAIEISAWGCSLSNVKCSLSRGFDPGR